MEDQKPRKKVIIKVVIFGVVTIIAILYGSWFFGANFSSGSIKNIAKQPAFCKRTTPFKMEPKFQRALSIVEERAAFKEEFGKLRNCLKIEYANSASELSGADGVFQLDQDGSTYLIKVSPSYKADSDTVTALLLVHEIFHAIAQDVRLRNNNSYPPAGVTYQDYCVFEEVASYSLQLFFVIRLDDNERLTLVTRAFLDEVTPEDTRTIESVKQLIKWGLQADPNDLNSTTPVIEKYVRDSPYYQKQCKLT